MTESPSGERIAKVIARSGLCSRREAERMIESGRVSLDGNIIDKPGINVTPSNVILVDGKPIAAPEKARLWIFHKPKGVITSNGDPQGRKTVFEILPDYMPRVISVGRLDFNTEGLLLLTNDGKLARHMELPSTGWVRKYKVRAFGTIENHRLDILRRGATISGVKYGSAKIEVEKTQNDNSWLTVSITEGKNREVRKMLEFIGLEVNRLIRVSYGPFQLGSLDVLEAKEVSEQIIRQQINFQDV